MNLFNMLFMLLFTFAAPAAHANKPLHHGLVHEYQLKNGLKLIVKEDHRAPVISSQVWYKVGSAYEHGGITGLSHLLEHLMFNGTKKYGPGEFSRIIAANGGQENAGTNQDYTFYFQKLAADKLELSFKLEADRMVNLQITPKEFKKEKQVVMEERRMRTDANPQAVTYERYMATAHLTTPYHHPIVGWMNDLENLQIQDAQNWYKKWYAPNNAILVIIGDVKPHHVFKLAQQYFAKLTPRKIPTLKPQKNPNAIGQKQTTVKLPAKLSWLIMGYSVPSVKTTTVQWEPYALNVLATILGGNNSSRLAKSLIREKQIASSAATDYSPFTLFASLFSIQATPTPNHTIAQIQAELQQQINNLQNNLVSDAELNRVKTQVVAQRVYAQDSVFYQGMLIGSLETINLPWSMIDDYVTKVQAITPQQVQAVARKYLVPQRLTVATLQPLPLAKQAPKAKGE